MFKGIRNAVAHRRLGSYLRFVVKLKMSATFRIVWKPCRCAVCSQWFNRRSIVGGIENDYACASCVASHNGPGKFERYSFSDEDGYNHDSEDMAKVLVLDALSMDSAEDDMMTSEGWGYCGRFGRYLLYQDDRGFVTFDEYQDEARAIKEFERLYLEGWGADESDAYISHEWNGRSDSQGWEVSFDGKPLHLWPRNDGSCDERRAIARVRLESAKTGYYPNLWLVNDHGNLTNVSY